MKRYTQKSSEARASQYDPFLRGPFPVGVRTVLADDAQRRRIFPCEVWYPAAKQHTGQDLALETQDIFTVPLDDMPRRQLAIRDAAAEPGTYPLVVFSHGSGRGARRMATFLCTHLSSHGYVVAALDHSELVAPELARQDNETSEQKAARGANWAASRVLDISFLLDHLLSGALSDAEIELDHDRIGIVGHSFGGWTALAALDFERRLHAVVALAPGGSSQPRPGILHVKLAFAWGRNVPALYLAAENDVMTPLDGIYELFDRTPATRQMVILRRADHIHFMDMVEREHETARAMLWPGELAWIPREMRPIAELCSEEQAHLFVRGLTLCHMDAVLRRQEEPRRFLAGDIEAELAARGVDALAHRP
ncbi:MAG: alpha/beta fold hydrolase [Blastocatellia bacterium]|nr:alpha/beta fold hydrolase [Blastocatellia bacterium]